MFHDETTEQLIFDETEAPFVRTAFSDDGQVAWPIRDVDHLYWAARASRVRFSYKPESVAKIDKVIEDLVPLIGQRLAEDIEVFLAKS